MEEEIARQALETAEETIRTLRGAVEALTLEQQQLENQLTAMKEEHIRQKRGEAGIESLSASSLPKESQPGKHEGHWAKELSRKLSFYYKDFATLDGKRITAEDGELMYHILGYVFDTLKRTGVEFTK